MLLARSGGAARVLAGGQSLIPMLRRRLIQPEALVDIRKIAGMRDISWDGDRNLSVGAMVTHHTLERWASDHGQHLMVDAAAHIGPRSVRTMGAVVGSLAHADPAAEWSAVALVLEGTCHVAGPDTEREIMIDRLFTGVCSNSLASDELITRLTLVLPGPGTGTAFAEVAPRHGDPAVVGAAALIGVDSGVLTETRVALIGLAATPLRARTVEAALAGRPAYVDIVETAARAVENDIAPLGDIHGSAEYRRRVAPVVVARALRSALARAEGARR